MAFVYGLRAIGETDYFYIGSTKNSLEQRFKQHINTIKYGRTNNAHLVRKVKKVGLHNIVIEPITECAEHDRFEIEYKTISEAIGNGVRLTNVVVSARDFELRRTLEEYDEYEITPRHIEGILSAAEFGYPVRHDPLINKMGELLVSLSRELVFVRTNETLSLIREVMAANYDRETAERQTECLHQRVSAMLERHSGGIEGGVLS